MPGLGDMTVRELQQPAANLEIKVGTLLGTAMLLHLT